MPDIIVIDNFYDNPDSVRQNALTCEYMPVKHDTGFFKFGHAPWPGRVSVNAYSPKNLDLSISKLLSKQVRQLPIINSGRFRMSRIDDIQNNMVHLDGCDYAGVLYLNDIANTPGTIFYTHKKTNCMYGSKDLFDELILNNEVHDTQFWDINFVSNIVYNRLIVYPANMFHGIGPLFGTTNEDARLVQIFFWETI